MKILVVCDQGNNRSVTVAHHLKYRGHDVLTAGVKVNSPETIRLLCQWADRIIITETGQLPADDPKVQLWNIGPDKYPRPFNSQLYGITRKLAEQHNSEYAK